MVVTMAKADASIKVTREVRDKLAKLSDEYGGTTLSKTLDLLIREHEHARMKAEILAQYDRLRRDPEAWADYLAEVEEWAELGAATVRQSEA
jgi:ABC-type taurine transport system substrate-binding protein